MAKFDLARWRNFNPYEAVRPLLFRLDPERAHHLIIKLLRKGIGPRFVNNADTALYSTVCGLDFPNPIGLAAGFDKQIEVIAEMFGFGFGSVELGSITPQPQPGNPQPRLFRIPAAEALINRYGFNSDGADACLRRLVAWYDATSQHRPGPVGVNLGKNKDSLDPGLDFAAGIKTFAPYADYLTVNISSPNTPGLRELQKQEFLDDLLARVMAARNAGTKKPPLFVKIAPDLSEEEATFIAASALAHKIDGLIIGNTTLSRPKHLPPELAKEAGGLSGRPLFKRSTKVLAFFYRATDGKLPLIGCGGVFTAADAYAKIRAGASLVQLYTALIYQGPLLIRRINRELPALLQRDGFGSITEAVGADHR